MEAEHGVSAAILTSPTRNSVLTGLAYLVGSGVPALAALLSGETTRIWVTFIAVVASLVITSLVVARSDRIAPTVILRRTLTIGFQSFGSVLVCGLPRHSPDLPADSSESELEHLGLASVALILWDSKPAHHR